jgi:rhamnose utilization protein RhaD (predicted bifunctional aldolase and dehydrogenase)
MNQLLKQLQEISHSIGRFPEFVQGGGGNTSIKLNDDLMAIKASGYTLKQLSDTDGFTVVNYKEIRRFLEGRPTSDTTCSEFVSNQIIQSGLYPNLRPSMETGFHSILKKVVIHTHSIYSNILTCSQEGEAIAKTLFPGSVWIDYCTPGLELTMAIKDRLDSGEKPEQYFLKNHGVIVDAETKEEALEKHQRLNDVIKTHFNIRTHLSDLNYTVDINTMKKQVLFPDQVVYTVSDEMRHSQAGKETLAAYYFILNEIERNRLTPSFVPQDKAEIIENLESEKYRKGLAT